MKKPPMLVLNLISNDTFFHINFGKIKPWFVNPCDPSRKCYGLYDITHLVKSWFNNLMDHICIWNGCHVSKEIFEKLLSKTTTEISSGYKLTRL